MEERLQDASKDQQLTALRQELAALRQKEVLLMQQQAGAACIADSPRYLLFQQAFSNHREQHLPVTSSTACSHMCHLYQLHSACTAVPLHSMHQLAA